MLAWIWAEGAFVARYLTQAAGSADLCPTQSSRRADPTHALVAQLGVDGVYHDVATGVAIARAVAAGTVLIDLDRASAVSQSSATDDDRPKLCPTSSEDRPGGRKLYDEMYEQYVRNTVNPQRNPQLPPGLTFALPGDTKSGWVHFDDCRESDGTMIEAKGNYAGLVATDFGMGRLETDWLKQAGDQVRASQGRRVEWYFHDASAAAFATDEPFQMANPAHVAAARQIEAALQPLNQITYPIDDPYR